MPDPADKTIGIKEEEYDDQTAPLLEGQDQLETDRSIIPESSAIEMKDYNLDSKQQIG